MSHRTGFSTDTPDLLAFIEQFLTALCDPDGGELLYQMHASYAAVRHASAIRRAAEVDVGSFGRAHREINVRGRGVLPNLSRPALLKAPLNSSDVESVAWFEVTETRERRKLTAALGLWTLAGVRRIGWCTLASRVEAWSYGDGLLQSLADYPWMRRAEPAIARALLDASYFRRYWREPVKFTTLPDARFSCHMSTACCKHDFEITLPPEAQVLIDAMPWQTLAPHLSGTRLTERPDGKLQLKATNETCRFLGARGQCLIHQTLGRQPFGACSVFPYAFAQTPEGIAVSLSPICGSTRLGLGSAPLDREDELREKLAQAEPRRTDAYRLTPKMEVPWESFRDIEKALCDCLTAETLPMRRRLYIGTQLLGALSRGEPIDTQHWLSKPPVAITGELREVIRGMLTKILAWDRAALRTLPPTIPSELFNLEVRESPIVARILRYVVYSKVYSYPFDLTTAHNLLIVLYLLTLIMQSAFSGPLPDVLWQELGSLGVHGLLRNVLHDGVPEGFRALFGTSEFGQWLLAV
jgi:hypothetical protein